MFLFIFIQSKNSDFLIQGKGKGNVEANFWKKIGDNLKKV
jgi:hypothetical protein